MPSRRSVDRPIDLPLVILPEDGTIPYRQVDRRTWQALVHLAHFDIDRDMILVTIRRLGVRAWRVTMSDPTENLTYTAESSPAAQAFVLAECLDRLGLVVTPDVTAVESVVARVG